MADFKNPVVSISSTPLTEYNNFATVLTRMYLCVLLSQKAPNLRTLPTDAACQLDVLGHDRDTLVVNSTPIRVLKENHQVGFSSQLKRKDIQSLEFQVSIEVLGNLPDQTLEWELADEKFRQLWVATDLAESHGDRAVAVGLLNASRGGR